MDVTIIPVAVYFYGVEMRWFDNMIARFPWW